jgi:sortase A
MAEVVLNRTGHAGGTGAPGSVADTPQPAGQPGAGTSPPAAPAAASPRPGLRSAGISLLLLGALVLGFAGYLYGLSGVQEARSQTVMFTQLQNELANQVAPLGPTTPGSPVAILSMPSIGIHDLIVVQGTSPQNLTLGPGHRRDTPMPGQGGVSAIYGHAATSGAPFARLAQLQPGGIISVITGQGVSTYTVAAVTDGGQVIDDPWPSRLVLMTASSPVIPSSFIEVDARLTASPRPSPGVAPVISSSELPMAGDHSSLALTAVMEWALALAVVAGGATFAALRWSPWPVYIVATPLILAVLWNLYQSLAMLLPNLY